MFVRDRKKPIFFFCGYSVQFESYLNNINMEKKVYCVIGERCKRITFLSKDSISDVKNVRDALIKACNNDMLLRSMINNQEIVLQKIDADRNNKLCDIEEDDEIEDKSEINVLLFPKPSSLLVESSSPSSFTSDICQDINIADTYNIKILHSEPVDLEVIDTEPRSTNLNDTIAYKIQNSPVMEDTEEKHDRERKDHIATPHTDVQDTKKSVKSQQKQVQVISKESSGSIPYPAILPPLSYDLQRRLKTDGTLKAQRYLIAFWGQYLWQATNAKPTKLDYNNLAHSIVTAYPELAGGKNGCEIVKSQLSTWIRNHRAVMKKQTQKRDCEGESKNATNTFASIVQTSLATPTESDITNALKELEKKFMENNMSHVKRLLKITLSVRRQWIENESNQISEIVKKYPSLQYYEMILFEFFNMKGITEDTLFEKIDVMINTLMQYFSIKENNEKSKTQILEQLNKYLAHKKYKKLHPTLFIVKEFLCSTEDLTTLEKEAPRAVIYTSDREEAFIAAAYIVADELKVKIPQPTVPKVIAGLLSAYFVWHVEYPISYANILEYIQHEILTTSLKSRSTVVMKFIRDCDNLKASLTT